MSIYVFAMGVHFAFLVASVVEMQPWGVLFNMCLFAMNYVWWVRKIRNKKTL